MRFFSIITAILVSFSLYLLVFERETLLAFALGDAGSEGAPQEEAVVEASPRVGVVALASAATPIEQIVLVRGRTEAARQVDVRAETSGQVISEPLRKGAFVEAGQLMCRIDAGTRGVALDEAQSRLAEARSRVPEAEARLAEALAAVPAAQARIGEAEARVPEARARLAEAEANIPAARARLAEAMARLPEAEARVIEANARLKEAEINLNAASELAKDGFASTSRVAAAQAATESARAGVQAAVSQLQGAKAGVQSAKTSVQGAAAGVRSVMSQIEGAAAGIQSAKSQVENARAGIQTAKSQVEGAKASVQSAKSGVESATAGVISAKSQLEGALAGVQSAKSGVESAKSGIQAAAAGVAGAEKEIERLDIHAPFAGLLESDTAELGSLLQPGGLCATVIQLDPIKLVGFVPETNVDKVRLGAPAGARLATGREVAGRVTFLSRAADPDTRTFRVEVEVANADLSIRDGQTAEIGIGADSQIAHLIPQSALTLDDDGKLGVRIVDADSRAGFVPVTVLRDTVEGMFVSGLEARADIIVVGQEFVTDGVPVDATYREAIQ